MSGTWTTEDRGDWIAMVDPDGSTWLEFHEGDKGIDKDRETVIKMVLAINQHDTLVAFQDAFLRLMDQNHASWHRWRDLEKIRAGRGLMPDEKIEHDAFVKIVESLDDRDEARTKPEEAKT